MLVLPRLCRGSFGWVEVQGVKIFTSTKRCKSSSVRNYLGLGDIAVFLI